MTAAAIAPPANPIEDEHRVLLWQTAAYADDLVDAAGSSRRLAPTYDALLQFLHYRLLPYLSEEEGDLPPDRLRDGRLAALLATDHDRLRADVDNIELSHTRRLLAVAAEVLVEHLDRHMRREEGWLGAPAGVAGAGVTADEQWALPLLLRADIDLDALPTEHRDALVLRRLQGMHPGETVRLHAGHDLHPLWRRHQLRDRDSHGWVYERSGPAVWVARVTRHDPDRD